MVRTVTNVKKTAKFEMSSKVWNQAVPGNLNANPKILGMKMLPMALTGHCAFKVNVVIATKLVIPNLLFQAIDCVTLFVNKTQDKCNAEVK